MPAWLQRILDLLGGWTPIPPPPPGVPPIPTAEARRDLVNALNAERQRAGLAPYTAWDGLNRNAQDWAGVMARQGKLDHGGWGQRIVHVTPGGQIGEDIAQGQTSIAEVVASWMSSPGHRAAILSTTYRYLGVGWATASDGQIYWTADFSA
jgi:uncharacterized protein YkwD